MNITGYPAPPPDYAGKDEEEVARQLADRLLAMLPAGEAFALPTYFYGKAFSPVEKYQLLHLSDRVTTMLRDVYGYVYVPHDARLLYRLTQKGVLAKKSIGNPGWSDAGAGWIARNRESIIVYGSWLLVLTWSILESALDLL